MLPVCKQEVKADIVFLVDGSWSIGTENFQQIRDFLYTLVNSFSVGPNQVRIGMAQYSTDRRTEFLLNTFQDKQEILEYIKKLPYKGGGTMTGLGLDFILKEQFVEQAGSRAGSYFLTLIFPRTGHTLAEGGAMASDDVF